MVHRDHLAALARETVEIIDRGFYLNGRGERVELREQIERAVAGTVEYAPDAELPNPEPKPGRVHVKVQQIGTFEAAHRIRTADPVVLNFASATQPGGGFLLGAQAQEEALARDSALYACIRGRDMYRINRDHDRAYSHAMIYSPAVPVFRGGDDSLIDVPWRTAIITAPAPNAGAAKWRTPGETARLEEALSERARRVLVVAHDHGHRNLVLGAWGCGVFRNDPGFVAAAFRDLLAGPFAGAFDLAVFAILDRTREQRVFEPFRAAFT